MEVSPTCVTMRGIAADSVRSGFCHWRSPEELFLSLGMTRSSRKPTSVMTKIVIMLAKRRTKFCWLRTRVTCGSGKKVRTKIKRRSPA